MSRIVIVDASVFSKLVMEEQDSDEAIEFFAFAQAEGYFLSAPSLFLYEFLAVVCSSGAGQDGAYAMFQKVFKAGFELVEMNDRVIRKALEIANTGHPKSGFPSFYDSAYHALAIERGAVFLTSDQRHAAKASGFGSVVLLKDWRAHFQTPHSS